MPCFDVEIISVGSAMERRGCKALALKTRTIRYSFQHRTADLDFFQKNSYDTV